MSPPLDSTPGLKRVRELTERRPNRCWEAAARSWCLAQLGRYGTISRLDSRWCPLRFRPLRRYRTPRSVGVRLSTPPAGLPIGMAHASASRVARVRPVARSAEPIAVILSLRVATARFEEPSGFEPVPDDLPRNKIAHSTHRLHGRGLRVICCFCCHMIRCGTRGVSVLDRGPPQAALPVP